MLTCMIIVNDEKTLELLGFYLKIFRMGSRHIGNMFLNRVVFFWHNCL